MKIIKPIVALLIITALSAGGFYGYRHYFARTSEQLEASGTIEATDVELQAKSAGAIKTLKLKEGDPAEKGQIVAELERNDLAAQKERDAMSVLSAEAKLQELLSGARDDELKAARAEVNLVQANLDQAQKDLERERALYEGQAISKEQWEKAETGVKVLEQQLEAAQARLDLLNSGSRSEQIAAASAEVERTRAVLQASESLLADLKVISPIKGVITSKNHEEGEYVQAGASLLTVTDITDLWIKVYIPTDNLPMVKLGQTVHLTVSGSNQNFTGKVIDISSKGEYTPKSIQTKQERSNIVYAVKISLDNPGGILKPGMPGDVVFDRS